MERHPKKTTENSQHETLNNGTSIKLARRIFGTDRRQLFASRLYVMGDRLLGGEKCSYVHCKACVGIGKVVNELFTVRLSYVRDVGCYRSCLLFI